MVFCVKTALQVELSHSGRHFMGSVHLAGIGDQVKAGDYQPAVPEDRLSRLIQSSVQPVAVWTLGDALHFAVWIDLGDGVGGKVGNIEVPLIVPDNAVGRGKLAGILGKGTFG